MSDYNYNAPLFFEGIKFKSTNFAGEEVRDRNNPRKIVNPAGKRNFTINIDDPELVQMLKADLWQVNPGKERIDQGTGDVIPARPYLPVQVRFEPRRPVIWLVTGKKRSLLDENTVSQLDNIRVESVDMQIGHGRVWEMNGREGVTAYLQKMVVVAQVDNFDNKWGFLSDDEPIAEPADDEGGAPF